MIKGQEYLHIAQNVEDKMILKKGSWIQIVKPSDPSQLKLPLIIWVESMNVFDGEKHQIESFSTIKNTYKLYGITYRWSKEWLAVLEIETDGRPIPSNNQGRLSCYWCGILVRIYKEKSANGLLTFNYCPKCRR